MTDGGWVSAHIFYRDDLDTVLVRLVRPLVAELAASGLARRYFFVRYWEGGPHLRLRLLPVGAARPVRERVARRASAFFSRWPAPDRDTDYLAVAERLARQEGRSDYLRELQPGNSLAFLPYRREHRRYGGEAAMPAVEEHFAESSRLALAMVCAGLTREQRHLAAIAATMLSWSHAGTAVEWLRGLTRLPPPDVPDAAERYRRHSAALARLADRLPAVTAAATPLRRGPLFRLQPEQGTPPQKQAGERSMAAWARSLASLRERLGEGADPTSVVSSCTHLFCNRLGVGLRDEILLRYLAARALLSHANGDGDGHGLA